MKRALKIFLVAALSTAFVSCDINTGDTAPPPSAPGSGIVTVQAGGSVVALAASVQMKDRSACTNDEDVGVPCVSVTWDISTAAGVFVESLIGEVGGTTQSSGLSPGCYLVTQTATAPGGLASSLPYNPEPGVGGVTGCDS